MVLYRTVAREAVVEQVIEKSRFIGYIRPVENREEADAFLKEIRAKHKDATHNVPAFVIGEKSEVQWASDDGEPSGTSGAPVLHLLTGENLTNTAIVITRYFGGIKLGTGGLMRAYTGVAREALDAAGISEVSELDTLDFKIDYTHYGKLQNLEQAGEFVIDNAAFEAQVSISLIVQPDRTEGVVKLLSEMTGGVVNADSIEYGKKLGKVDI